MNDLTRTHDDCCCCRREFLQTMGTAAGAVALLSSGAIAPAAEQQAAAPRKKLAVIRGGFAYPPSETLRQEGYWSWPGSTFDAESHQRTYTAKIRALAEKLGLQIQMEETPFDQEADVARFIGEVKKSPPDGLLLIPFKKGHWPHILRIIDETKVPSIVLATLGVLLVNQINQLHRRPGAYLINAMDDFEAVETGLKLIRGARRMKESLLLNISGSGTKEVTVPVLGTRVRTVPLEMFYEEYKRTGNTAEVQKVARSYWENAKERIEPTQDVVLDSARAYVALKRMVTAHQADAMMMNCLPGLRHPRRHVPPCMGFMTLRDEGIPAGCQADLNATLSLMLVQALFDKPGFQQNATMQTEANHFFGAHCTSPSKMHGVDGPAEPYILRSHAEAGWGCVPQVLFKAGQEVTLTQYVSRANPQLYVYSGEIVRCYPKAPGGCRTNVEMTIREVKDACDVKGMHQAIFYGNHARELRTFCQLYGIEAVS